MKTVRILGIDPGLRATGWGIIDADGRAFCPVAYGQIKIPSTLPLAHRLSVLYTQLSELISCHTPVEAAVEEIFINTNGASTLKLGFARGVALLAPAQHSLPVYEYSATCIKKTLTGTGHGEKNQIEFMVNALLKLEKNPARQDAADALALAITHAQFRHIHLV